MSDGGPVRDRDGRAQAVAPINWAMLATPKAQAEGVSNPESLTP
ncbi:hypothetical protein HBIAX_03026 [Achromobacter xylosoxidans]|nr:hypothetical protein HBIAX_03026 [Achromobacter xylosoxidans]